MGVFSKIKSVAGRVFGKKTPVFGRKEEDAATHATGQSGRRRRLLEERVKRGESAKVYKSKKPIDPLSTGAGQPLESPYLEEFLLGHPFSRFASSTIFRLQYDATTSSLHVQWLGGRGKNRGGPGKWSKYGQISRAEAKQFYDAASKGLASWDLLRIRGTRTGNKKPHTPNSPPPSYLPLKHGQNKELFA